MRVGDSRTDDEKLAAATELQEHILAARREHMIHIFGIRDDGLSRQYNYLIDEAQTIEEDGKGIHGPNAVISMLDHGLTAHSHGEQRMILHADNCAGQNKNRYVLAYMSWRTMVGLNREVVYLMQLPGHARCLVDAGFAHIKRLYRRSDCETLRDIERVVNLSAYSNVAVLYQGDGNQHTWDWRDRKTFLSQYFRALKGISTYQQFIFSTISPGVVFVKEHDDSEETPITIFAGGDVPTTRPPTIPAAGLSATRQQYLATNVRKYLHDANKEVTCPLPEE